MSNHKAFRRLPLPRPEITGKVVPAGTLGFAGGISVNEKQHGKIINPGKTQKTTI